MNTSDPLLSRPDPSDWTNRVTPRDDPLDRAVETVFDYFNYNAMAWPAWNSSGELNPPPAEHILDFLARAHDLVAEEDALTRPAAGTVAAVRGLPRCDLCGQAPARFDARVVSTERRPGAFQCPACYAAHGSGTLGATGDAYLLTYAEVPASVQETCNAILLSQGRPPLWP